MHSLPAKIAFVTGKLAAPALQEVVHPLALEHQFDASVVVAKISVAALMTTDWLRTRVTLPPGTNRVILPGNIKGELTLLSDAWPGVQVERGPLDLLDLPQFFGTSTSSAPAKVYRTIEILSEINHANRLSLTSLRESARRLADDGADIIDLGGTPGEPWPDLEDHIRALVDEGRRVSIDSFDQNEVERAVQAGATLILSAHMQNRETIADLGIETVLVPSEPHSPGWLDELLASAECFHRRQVPCRLDPVLDPIGFGFAQSLGRYLRLRQTLPEASILMGVGNLTELTEVDSAGVNAVLIGLCAELNIGSVLTTEVINWARTSTKEIDLARQLMGQAVAEHRLPKHTSTGLTMLRDPKLRSFSRETLRQMHHDVRDPNFRIFTEGGEIVAFNGSLFDSDSSPFALFERLGVEDASHAFYLGWEMMKASLAIQLGKQYVQDQALRWGFLTREEISHRLNKSPRRRDEE